MRLFKALFALILLIAVGGIAFLYAGVYDVAADASHWRGTAKALRVLRERSIENHAPALSSVPNLDDAALIAKGAAHYAEMCTGCHLAPGMADTELRQGLYPAPPKLAELTPRSPAQQFWVVKHGIKFTAMPAWGLTHDDGIVWAIVAFIQKLPKMSPEEYQNAVGPPESHESEHGESEGGAQEHEHGEAEGGAQEQGEQAPDQERTRKEPDSPEGARSASEPLYV